MDRIIRVEQALLLATLMMWAVDAAYCAEPTEDSQDSAVANLIKHIPAGYRFSDGGNYGDLNGDSINDDVILIKATDKKKIVRYDHTGILADRNRRGIMIFLSDGNKYRLALENRQCFSSENEEGGNYFAPDLVIRIFKGNLIFHYAHGRKGYWTYTFRYRKSEFELIGYDESGQYEEETISINFLTKKQLVKTCVRKGDEDEKSCADCCSQKFKETWNDIIVKEPIILRKIVDIDELDIDNYISKK